MYLFSVDGEGSKVVHVNYAPPELRSKGLDARSWAAKVAEVLGGKVRYRPRCNRKEGTNVHLPIYRLEGRTTAHKV